MRPMARLRPSVSLRAGVGTESNSSPHDTARWLAEPRTAGTSLAPAQNRPHADRKFLRNLRANRRVPAGASLHVVAGSKVPALSRRITRRPLGATPKSIRLNAGELIGYTGHVACSLWNRRVNGFSVIHGEKP